MCVQFAVRPYLMDLATLNGTFLNGERVEPQRYYELLPQVSLDSTMFTNTVHKCSWLCALTVPMRGAAGAVCACACLWC